MVKNGWKWIEVNENGYVWLKMDGNGSNSQNGSNGQNGQNGQKGKMAKDGKLLSLAKNKDNPLALSKNKSQARAVIQ